MLSLASRRVDLVVAAILLGGVGRPQQSSACLRPETAHLSSDHTARGGRRVSGVVAAGVGKSWGRTHDACPHILLATRHCRRFGVWWEPADSCILARLGEKLYLNTSQNANERRG